MSDTIESVKKAKNGRWVAKMTTGRTQFVSEDAVKAFKAGKRKAPGKTPGKSKTTTTAKKGGAKKKAKSKPKKDDEGNAKKKKKKFITDYF